MTLEQIMIEHSGASQEVFDKVVYDWLQENHQSDKQLGLWSDYRPNMPECCRSCPNNKNTFCNCSRPRNDRDYLLK